MAGRPEIRRLAPGDERAFTRHVARHMAESGRGEARFTPVVHLDEEDFERTAYERLARADDALDWFRAWVAVDEDGAFLGHVDLRGEGLEAARHRATLGIGVLREARGRGVGRALMTAALDDARARPGLDWIDLYVFAHNAPALALYRDLGFVEVGRVRERFRVESEPVDDVHMVLDLRSP